MTHIVIPDSNAVASLSFDEVLAIDISGFEDPDYISLSLPDFPATKLDLSKTFIDFTSHSEGDFGTGPTDQVAFDQASPALPGVDGDTEMRIPISLLATIDKTQLTGIRFRIYANVDCTFKCLSIRACSADWKYAPVDMDTLWNKVQRPPSTDGSVNQAYEFPATAELGWPTDFPILFRSDDTTGEKDPRPIDVNISTAFSTGSLTNALGVSINQAEADLSILDTFNRTENPLSNGGKWSQSFWGAAMGSTTTTLPFGWSPTSFATVAAAYWNVTKFTDTGSGVATEFHINAQTGATSRYFSLWASMPAPNTEQSGYKLNFTWLSGSPDTYDVLLQKWVNGVASPLATKAYTVPVGNDVMLTVIAGEVAGWTRTSGGSWTKMLSAKDSTYATGGYAGIEGSGSNPKFSNFKAGALSKTLGVTYNEFALYLRDIPTDDQIQLELNSLTQADLEAKKVQPDFGTAAYVTRQQEDLDINEQADLFGDTQFELERLPDYSQRTWLEVKLKWCSDPALNTLTLLNADGEGYTFTNFDLDPIDLANFDAGQYILIVNLEDNWIQARIYGIDQVGTIDRSNLVFDSGRIVDDTLVARRKGRVGWWTSLVDGDAYIYNLKTRGLNFGEIRTKGLRSITPVEGASLYAGSTSEQELVTEIAPTPWSTPVSITLDPAASLTKGAYKIVSSPDSSLQGIMSNLFLLDSFTDLRISFDIKFPSDAMEIPGSDLTVFLMREYSQSVPVNLSAFTGGVWSKVRVDLKDDLIQTGSYRLVVLQTKPISSTTWWLENLSIKATTVRWSARSHQEDPWGITGDQWVPAGITLNSQNGGIIFPETGDSLQVRGQALRQDSTVYEFQTIPRYARLGRFKWIDEYPDHGFPPNADIIASKSGNTVDLKAVANDPDTAVVSYLWSFGDNTYDSGLQVSHTYERDGTYVVTLIVSDDFGNTGSSQETITIP